MALRRLETVIDPRPGRPAPNPDHPMRKVTRQVAFEPQGWTPERAAKVVELFDGLAPEWHLRGVKEREDAVHDALQRGGPFPQGHCLELGSGVGLYTERFLAALGDVIAADLSFEMLQRAPHEAPKLLADGSQLPFADATFAVVVLVNMFLFPLEVDRLLRPDGVLVWVNTAGPATPIHLTADEVDRALPGDWDGVHADAGWGTWASFRRA